MSSLLLTSFAPWLAHQPSNASDDLITLLRSRNQLPDNTRLLRQLPVHFQLAPGQVIADLYQTRASVVVCCGMAERRSLLNLEQSARWEGNHLQTSLPLAALCQDTRWTKISHDAGDYVCNYLYYRLLDHIQKNGWSTQCLFVHVPPLTEHNRDILAQDFALILSRLHAIAGTSAALTAA